MARKSRKHPESDLSISKDTVGYIRLSVLNRDGCGWHWYDWDCPAFE